MNILNESEEQFKKRILSLKEKALNNNQMSMLKFLDLRSQEILKFFLGKDVFLYLSGGYDDSEYKKAIISPFELKNPDFKIDILKISYNKKFLELNHRKVLAVLMELGIKRETIGDIVFINDDVYICASNEISGFIIDNLRVISHNPVVLEKVDIDLKRVDNYDIKRAFVQSLRIDAVISAMYNISRNASQELIKSGNVKVNQSLITNTSHILSVGDILSVRGKGRMKFINVLGNTKSNRIMVELGKLM